MPRDFAALAAEKANAGARMKKGWGARRRRDAPIGSTSALRQGKGKEGSEGRDQGGACCRGPLISLLT